MTRFNFSFLCVTSQNHTGNISKATNFIYTGLSDKRTEWRMKDSNKFIEVLAGEKKYMRK